jgi:hypothetical protein
MNAWGKVNGSKGDDVLFFSDTKTFFSKEHAWQAAPGAERNGRWAMVIDNGKITYIENEKSPKDVDVSAISPLKLCQTNTGLGFLCRRRPCQIVGGISFGTGAWKHCQDRNPQQRSGIKIMNRHQSIN